MKTFRSVETSPVRANRIGEPTASPERASARLAVALACSFVSPPFALFKLFVPFVPPVPPEALALEVLDQPNHPLAGSGSGSAVGSNISMRLNSLSSANLASLYDALFHHAARDDRKSLGMGLLAGGGGVYVRSEGSAGEDMRVGGRETVAVAVAVAVVAVVAVAMMGSRRVTGRRAAIVG